GLIKTIIRLSTPLLGKNDKFGASALNISLGKRTGSMEPKEDSCDDFGPGNPVAKRTRSSMGKGGDKIQNRKVQYPGQAEEDNITYVSNECPGETPTQKDSSLDKDEGEAESSEDVASIKEQESSEDKHSKNTEEAIHSLHNLKMAQMELFSAQESA
ncbi:hypothetical protein KI387_040076, partial [Taxus chinensis]